MIISLHVSNYVLIDSLDLEFSSGLIAITGETGSGKSILLGALSLLLGAKGEKEDIRKGCDRAEISGVFQTDSEQVMAWLESHDIEADDSEIVIRRVIRAEGRSTYTVNGTPVTLKEGEELGGYLVDFSSQHAHHSLMKKDVLRNLLDDFSSNGDVLKAYSQSYRALLDAEKELEDTRRILESSREEKDYMSYCLSEIEKADLKEGEEDELRENLKKEANSEFLLGAIQSSLSDLNSARTLLSSAYASLEKAGRRDDGLSALVTRLDSGAIEIDDIYDTIRDYSSSFSFSEEEIEEMNSRLSLIQRIKRRYGGTVESALLVAEDYRKNLSLLEDSSEKIASLEKRVEGFRKECEERSEILSKRRHKGASDFALRIEGILHKLGMENAVFRIEVSDTSFSLYGKDSIEYMIAPNKGERMTQIQNSASGGELSRIMLAIKASCNSSSSVETLLFDEIDAGLGGSVANFVADELKQLSSRCQVITITHLAQIASRSDSHFVVAKNTVGERTISSIREVREEDRVRETARLLSGDVSDISLRHAEELLASGRNGF